ncbi:MAG: hypothetical protein KJ826_07335 [Proteobacteria bacterium]|nr:hypothetical protein [Pseudomonadota bacterium]
MTKEREAASDVQLSEDLSHVTELPQGKDFCEWIGGPVMGESDGHMFLLGAGAWRTGGGRKGKWRVDDSLMGQNMFMMVPNDQWGSKRDNDFIANRLDPTEWAENNIRIVQKPGEVSWEPGNRQYISRPPYWEMKGEQQGVECNLTLGGLGKASRVWGLYSDLAKTGKAGYHQCCWAEGTITVKGKTYALENGYGIHEMMTFSETYDHTKAMREPYYYIGGMSKSTQIFILSMPAGGLGYGHAYVNGKEISFGLGEIVVDELDWWTDPQTLMRVPGRWHVNMNSDEGIADLNMVAGGRIFYCFITRRGHTTRYGNLVKTNGRIFLPGGQIVLIRDMLTYLEWGRLTMTLDGGTP